MNRSTESPSAIRPVIVRRLAVAAISALALLAGCATPAPPPTMPIHAGPPPRSILILPPLNESVEVRSQASFLASVSKPIAERGYYVFPVAVVDELMKANGLPTAAEMHAVPLTKLVEIIGPDAVLYPTIIDYGRRFSVVSSANVARIKARLVDARTGEEIWSGEGAGEYDPASQHQSGGGLAGLILGAIVNHAIASAIEASGDVDSAYPAMRMATGRAFTPDDSGLPIGPLRPEYGKGSKAKR